MNNLHIFFKQFFEIIIKEFYLHMLILILNTFLLF
jgi:hypothetical protein